MIKDIQMINDALEYHYERLNSLLNTPPFLEEDDEFIRMEIMRQEDIIAYLKSLL